MNREIKTSGGFTPAEIIIGIVVIALIGLGGWYVVQANSSKNSQSTSKTNNSSTTGTGQTTTGNTTNQTSNQNVFKIPELGVKFDIKSGISPLYNIDPNTQNLSFSTQQLVDKGATELSNGSNPCSFGSQFSSTQFTLSKVYVYSSAADALTAYNNGVVTFIGDLPANNNGFHKTRLSISDVTPANGFISAKGKVFFVPQESQNQSACTNDGKTESQQWLPLHDSLMTLRASQ